MGEAWTAWGTAPRWPCRHHGAAGAAADVPTDVWGSLNGMIGIQEFVRLIWLAELFAIFGRIWDWLKMAGGWRWLVVGRVG